jgi:adenylyl- and sulfurtransferase ThiI
MTTDITERLRSVQTRRSQAATKRARDEVEVENAQKALDEAKKNLELEFGIKTSADLREVREKLVTELEEAVSAAEKALEEAGA